MQNFLIQQSHPGADCDPLALTTAVNTLAVAISTQFNAEDLSLLAAILTQLGDTLETLAAQRERCSKMYHLS